MANGNSVRCQKDNSGTATEPDPDTDEGNITDKFDPTFASVLQAKGYIADASNIHVDDVKDITDVNVSESELTSLKGIEYFTSLQRFFCENNQISSVNISNNIELTNIDISHNLLEELDVTKNTKILYLYCDVNKLTSLNVSNNTELIGLSCYGNELEELDVTKNTKLKSLDCRDNSLTSLDVTKNLKLERLDCFWNDLVSLDVTNNTELTSLECAGNTFSSLDVSKNTKLQSLWCNAMDLTFLDISNNTELTGLCCTNNELTSLDLTNNTKLQRLYCAQNKLASLDISNNTALYDFDCGVNPGEDGTFVVTSWFDNNSIPENFTVDSWTYNGSSVTIDYQLANSGADLSVTNLSADGTANSYIVSEAGTYKFSTVQGNSSTSVGEVAAVEVLWETYGTDVTPEVGDLVSNVSYADNAITFNASDKKGNALIAAKDSQGNILWSWHIWMTDQPEDQEYRNNAGIMMDRNLGAISTNLDDVGTLGLIYQWGRKDPFLGMSSVEDSYQIARSVPQSSVLSVQSDASSGTIDYARLNPTTHICCNTYNDDWYYTGDESTDDTRWGSIKTIYDPCPVGYRVPDGGEDGVWAKGLNVSSGFSGNLVHNGFDFGTNSDGYAITMDDTCFYPLSGYKDNDEITIFNVNNWAFYWSCTSVGNEAYGLCLYRSEMEAYPLSKGSKAYGYSVRCQKIE